MTAYTTFIKHAEKVTKSASSGRPILKGVCHNVDGSVVVTDSHRLYILANGFKTDEQTIIDPKTGAKIDGNYPDTRRLLPYEDDAVVTLKFDAGKALTAVKAMYAAHKVLNAHDRHMTLEITENERHYVEISAGDTVSDFIARYTLGYNDGGKVELTSVQPQYLQDALALFKDSGEQDATLRWYGAARPLTLSNSDVTALILPVRKP